MKTMKAISILVVLVLFGGIAYGAFEWFVNRIYVPEGKSLQLRYKGPLLSFVDREEAEAGHFAAEGQVGVLARMRGPGRHFYCPIWWDRKLVDDIVVGPGHVAIVTSKLGDALPPGEFLVDGDLGSTKHNGILRKVFGPGRYRANPYAYTFDIVPTQTRTVGQQIKHSGWVEIPTGYIGVVTYKSDDPTKGTKAGVPAEVLPSGLYPVNPHEREIDIVEIGFRETSIKVTKKTDQQGKIQLDESGEPVPVAKTGINFPSDDAFEIQMDFTTIWGIMPQNASDIVRKYGNVDAVELTVIRPQSESICRNNGSKLRARELLVGESREQFQTSTSQEFGTALGEKGITLLYGLIRHIYIPQEVRTTIQKKFIANEVKLTRDQETETTKTEADLEEAKQKVKLEAERIRVETTKLVAELKAEGDKKARETEAETKQLVAAIDRQVAEIEAKKVVTLGEAEATAERLQQEAKAAKFALAVDAFGVPAAYTQWQFAEGLPERIDLNLLYAGEGTLWTDLKNITPTVPLRQPKK